MILLNIFIIVFNYLINDLEKHFFCRNSAALFTMTTTFQSISIAPITLDINKAKNPGPGFTAGKDQGPCINRCNWK